MTVLPIGIKGESSAHVTPANTAVALGSGTVPLLATPAMVALMEKAARLSVEAYLEPGQTTVGTGLEVRHLAPTPVGLTVTVHSELVAVDGAKLLFKVEAFDGVELVGTGMHSRYIVDEDRFVQKAASKKQPPLT